MIYYPKNYGISLSINKTKEIYFSLKNEFKDKNIIIYNNKSNINKDDIVVLNYYGESKDTYDYLLNNKITFYDSVSNFVEKTRNLISNNYNNFKIIILCNKETNEVINYNSWCLNNALIIKSKNDYKKITNQKYFIVYSSDTSIDKVNNLQEYLNSKNIQYEINNDIYENQYLINDDMINLSNIVNKLIVIGNDDYIKDIIKKCNKNCDVFLFNDINDFYNKMIDLKFESDLKIGFTASSNIPKTHVYKYSHLLEFLIHYNFIIDDNVLYDLDIEEKLLNEIKNSNDIPLLFYKINTYVNDDNIKNVLFGFITYKEIKKV